MRIRALGPVEVEHDGVAISVGGRQQRRLLALLVINRGRPVSTARLVDALWPDGNAPEGALRSMRTYLSRLRATLPNGRIVARNGGYVLLGDGATFDVDDFERLVAEAERSVPDSALDRYDEAVALWRGEPFGEFADEWWALAESTRLTELRSVAQENRVIAMMALGHHHRAIPEIERLVIEHPLRERPVRLLMQSLQATGRSAEALRVARAFRARLADDTGLEPSSELVALESSIVTDEPATGSPGRPLRGYTIHRAIGEGAHGRVYEATQPGTERPVAIKAIRPDLADSAEFIRRFDAEARLVARLEHPHIVPLYDYWREPGGAYLVFRLLGGGTVGDSVVVGGPWSFERVSRLVEEIGAALMAAHAAGVVHRDVKCSNVLLDEQGAAYLTDFGIAVTDRDPTDHEADVSGLAVMAWELLTGTHAPGRGTDPLPTLIGHHVGVPDGIDAVLARATDGSFTTIAEVILAWRAAAGNRNGALSPITSSERHIAQTARHRAVDALTRSATAGQNPYRGLRPFDEGDAAQFFGRSEVVDDLIERVARSRVVTVIGASGSGKSSVVRAGLTPRLRSADCVVATMVPGDDPLGALNAALAEVATASDVASGSEPVEHLGDIARRAGRLVVIVDQFEECWTRSTAVRRDAFLDEVVGSARNATSDVTFVVTVRADLIDRPLEHATLGPLIGDGACVLGAPSPADLDAAIARPAANVGVAFDDGVVADLTAEAAGQPGSLPLLQFTLAELYERRVDGVIGRDALDALGGMAGAIGRRAEELYRDLDPMGRDAVRELFTRLVVPGAPDTRRRARRRELVSTASPVIDRFVDARLLTADRDPATREPTVEIAHEALLTRWQRLAEWVDDDRRWLDQLQHLAAAARSWDAERSDSELYRGARLEAALEAIEVDGRSVSPLEREFLEAGRHARDVELLTVTRTARRLRRRLSAVAAALVVALIAGVLAIIQRSDARDAAQRAQSAADAATDAEAAALTAAEASATAERAAQVEALVGRAESLRSSQRDVAALLAVEAYRLEDTPRTRSALFATFTDGQGFLDASRFPGERGTSGIVLPDGVTAFVTAEDGRVHPYDLDGATRGEPLPSIGNGDRFPVLAGSPDSALLAVATKDDPLAGPTSVTIFDVAGGSAQFDPVVVDEPVTAMAFLPDGRLALATGENGHVVILDATSGAVIGEVAGLDVEPDTVVWTSDPVLRRPSSVAVARDELLVGAADGHLRVLDVDTLDVRRTFALAGQTLSNLSPLDDGTVVTAGRLGMARVDVTTGAVLWANSDFDRCADLLVVEERDVLFCGDPYGRLEELDLTVDGSVLRRLDVQDGSTESLWIAAGGTELVAFGRNEPVVSRWRLDGSGPITEVVAPGWTPYAFNHTGELLVLENDSLQTMVLDVADPSTASTIDGFLAPAWVDEDSLTGALVRPDGSIEVATFDLGSDLGSDLGADPSMGTGIMVDEVPTANDLDTGKQRMVLRYGNQADSSLASFDPVTMERSVSIPVDGYVIHAINRAGDRIAAGTANGIEIFDTATGELVDALRRDDLRQVFITVTDQLYAGSLGGELTQYDLETLAPIRSFGGSRGQIFHLHGTADGSMIAFSGSDRRAALYDVASGVQLGDVITIADDQRNAIRLSLDGRWLAVGGQPSIGDGVPPADDVGEQAAQIWDLDPDSWVEAACGVAGRDLSRAEWADHIGELAPYRETCSSPPAGDM